MRRGLWALGLLLAGCWRENPAFIAGLELQSSGGVESETTGAPGMSSGPGSTGPAETTGGASTSIDSDTTAVGPGTTGGPGTSVGTDTGETTGEPGSSTSNGETTEGPLSEQQICDNALADQPGAGDVLLDMSLTPCQGKWTASDTKNPGVTLDITCKVVSNKGFVLPKAQVAVKPNVAFGPSLLTGTQALPTLSGTIEGEFSGIDLSATAHPCFLATVGCPVDQVGPCSLDIQVFIKSALSEEWGAPVIETVISDLELAHLALPLADYKGEPIAILIVAQNDLAGAPQEIAAWQMPQIVDALP